MLGKNLMVSVSAIFLAALVWSGSAMAQPATDSQRVGDRNIFARMNVGDPDMTLATNGPLSLVASCFRDDTLPGFERIIALVVVTSSEDNWMASGVLVGPQPAGAFDFVAGVVAFVGNPIYENDIDGIGAVTPSGHYMGVGRETFALGADVSQILGSDCIFTGQVITTREPG